MSGFICLLHTKGEAVDSELLTRLTSRMTFRGPDALHTWHAGNVGLGHTLLAVTFESQRERQPCSLDGKCWLAGDLRLDARRELVAKLEAGGRSVAADAPDPDLLLQAYDLWGESCLDHLIGDFSFVLWDSQRQRLWAVRDHFGVAQLFWAKAGDTLLLGNTLDALLAHPGVSHELDETAVLDNTVFGFYLDNDATAYAAIHRLPHSHTLTWERGEPHITPYWFPAAEVDWLSYRREEEYAERFLEFFDQAVADRLRTDRAGTHLSGGLDASSITASACDLLKARGQPFDLRAYTMIFQDLIPDDEGQYAALVAARSGVPVEYLAQEEILARSPLDSCTWVPPEPGPVFINGYTDPASDRTAAFARVLLAGFGGDPLFEKPPFDRSTAGHGLRHGQWAWSLRAGLGRLRRAGRDPLKRWRPPDWLAPRRDWSALLKERWRAGLRGSRRDALSLWTAPFWRNALAWADAGYHGRPLSVVFPFFDRRLFDFMRAVPIALRGRDKPLLRRAMSSRLPFELLARPKTPLVQNPYRAYLHRIGDVPSWEMELMHETTLARWIDLDWLDRLQAQPAHERLETWLAHHPPITLGYWLRRRFARY